MPDPLFTRRRFLAASAVGATAIAANAFWVEPNRLKITEHTLGVATPGRSPLRVVQLSDLHLQQVGRHEERIAHAVHQLSADVVLLTGDVIDRADQLPTLRTFLSLLPSTGATYAILGNWEHWARLDVPELTRVYEAFGVQLLVNATATWHHQGHRVLLTGLDDATGGRPDVPRALQDVAPAANHLMLAHSPVFRDTLAHESLARNLSRGDSALEAAWSAYAPQYMLSGHTHGGQINLLGWAPFCPPGSGRYVRGWYRDQSPHLYVSQGLGTSVLPVRFGAVPEIACFTWHLRA